MHIWKWPILIGVLTVFGLLSALLGQYGLWVWLAWTALSVPLFVILLSIKGTSAPKLTREMIAHLERLNEKDWRSHYQPIRALPRVVASTAGPIFSRAYRQAPLLNRAASEGSDVCGKFSLSARAILANAATSVNIWFMSPTGEWRKAVLFAVLDGTLVWIVIHVAMPPIIELVIYALMAVGVILALKNAAVAAIRDAIGNCPDV
jgi:hypothetical protein